MVSPSNLRAMPTRLDDAKKAWVPVDRVAPAALSKARLELHHAAQVANAPAMSYLAPKPDDSHTNFVWNSAMRTFISSRVPFPSRRRFAWRPADLTLLALDDEDVIVASLALTGCTEIEAHAWASAQCAAAGGDGAKYTAKKHYMIPARAGDGDAVFGADWAALGALSAHWGNAVPLLDAVAAESAGSSTVCLWPHHFDVGLIISLDASRSIGVGFSPGDESYDEPYWYTSPYPAPSANAARPALAGGAHWHDAGWFSAVLNWSAYADARSQGDAVARYLESAIEAARTLVRAEHSP